MANRDLFLLRFSTFGNLILKFIFMANGYRANALGYDFESDWLGDELPKWQGDTDNGPMVLTNFPLITGAMLLVVILVVEGWSKQGTINVFNLILQR